MPSPLPTAERLCLYGDSHLAAAKLALDAGLVDPGRVQIEFFGAQGPEFRKMRHHPGQVIPDPDALEALHLVNGGARDLLKAEDFANYLFIGGRLRLHELFPPLLAWRADPDRHLSAAIEAAVIDKWLISTRAYRVASDFAARGARVWFSPASFLTEGVADMTGFGENSAALNASEAEADALWALVQRRMQRDGLALIRPPANAITQPCLTRADFAVAGAAESNDAVHKSPAYAALALTDVLGQLADARQSAL